MHCALIALVALGMAGAANPVAAQTDFDALEYRNVGPTRGGRVTAVAGTVQEPGTFYLGASGGGVWKTMDYGETWGNVSDGFFASPSIGDIAVSQSDPNILYVGTGSDGLRSNVIRGLGVYRSRDGGETWQFVGLRETGHIGAVEIDPRDNNTVWVAAIGQAFSRNTERGIYKTTDGGTTWSRVLYLSDESGFSDLELVPANPEVVFATAWKARRTPWTIISGGEQDEGGLFKSDDGGQNWRRITKGLPQGLIGKIDLAVSAADSKIVYALVEAPGDEGGVYRSDDQGETFRLVSNKKGLRTRPFYYANIEADPTDPDTVYAFATNSYRSRDGGITWEKLTPPHGDSHDIWINPANPRLFVQANDGGANVTHNAGESWSTQFNQPTTEVYQVEVDDRYPYWLYGGQQDNSTTIAVPSRPPYRVQHTNALLLETGGCETGPAVPKPGDPDTVYANCKGRFGVMDMRTGTERRYYIGAANIYSQNPADLRFRFQRVAPVHVSPHDPDTVYMGSQYLHRTRDDGVTWETISPDLTAFEADKQVISGSPITRDITGEEYYSALYSIRESSIEAGVIWTGSNDGPIHLTRDGGKTWTNVTPRGLPSGGRVDSIAAGRHAPGVAYVAVHRYLLGDWKPYIYRTENYGRRWTLLTSGENGIPEDYPVRVVREDPVQAGLLYAGTEYGVFVSFDDGATWASFQQNLPVTPVTDIKIFRDDLVVSTMGRGFWILDKASAALRAAMASPGNDVALFTPSSTIRYRQRLRGHAAEAVPQFPVPGMFIDYRLPDTVSDPVTLEILDSEGEVVNAYQSDASGLHRASSVEEDMAMSSVIFIDEAALTMEPGINRFLWDMRARGPWDRSGSKRYRGGPLVPPGTYTLRLRVGDAVVESTGEIQMDPRVAASGVLDEGVRRQYAFRLQVRDLLSDARRTADDLHDERALLSEGSPRIEVLNAALSALETEEGTYMPPRLIDQTGFLYDMTGHADQLPGNHAEERLAELRAQYERILESL